MVRLAQVYGQWRHWQQGELTPPGAISSNYYPLLGAYDSGDRRGAVARHMHWLPQAGTGVLTRFEAARARRRG
ncbi:hypothetical protein [Streptomyces sp. NPDC006012]|uniref:hypothetical protein n=1 Tax=Streptomyces sp. NPDC006012 TaxID=3364739 RepID=UPI00368392A0